MRRAIFENNLKSIEEHNEKFARGETSYFRGINDFTDMTKEERRAKTNCFTMNGTRISRARETASVRGLPDEVDWRKEGYVTKVSNQGICGSCWAFSALGALEGQHFKATGDLILEAASQLVDCSFDWGNKGCNGGNMEFAYNYIIDVKGIESDDAYPYEMYEQECYFDVSKVVATMSSYTLLPSGSEDDLQKAVAEVGPISVAIDASRRSFHEYDGGIYDDPACGSRPQDLNHAVVVVGYGSQDGKDYYIVKNSWGEYWGDNGYILMSRNKNNQCGIATYALYPTV